MSSDDHSSSWTFLTNHTQVLICIAEDVDITLREVANKVGITERAAQRIVADLVEAGYIDRTKVGRRNRYHLNGEVRMRHVAQADYEISELLRAFHLPPEQPGDNP